MILFINFNIKTRSLNFHEQVAKYFKRHMGNYNIIQYIFFKNKLKMVNMFTTFKHKKKNLDCMVFTSLLPVKKGTGS